MKKTVTVICYCTTRYFLSYRINNAYEVFYQDAVDSTEHCVNFTRDWTFYKVSWGTLMGIRETQRWCPSCQFRHSSREIQPLKTYLPKSHSILSLIIVNANIAVSSILRGRHTCIPAKTSNTHTDVAHTIILIYTRLLSSDIKLAFFFSLFIYI